MQADQLHAGKQKYGNFTAEKYPEDLHRMEFYHPCCGASLWM
jgi:hypothetical protein